MYFTFITYNFFYYFLKSFLVWWKRHINKSKQTESSILEFWNSISVDYNYKIIIIYIYICFI